MEVAAGAWRRKWGKRTGYPTTVDPKAIGYSFPRTPDFEKFRIPFMDEFGIAMQVISTGSPGIQGFADAQAAVINAKKINDAQAEILGKYPGRFAGFAALPTQDPKAAGDELERAVEQLGFKGAMIQGSNNWEYLDAEKYWVIWERAAALEAPIYLHVQEPSFAMDYPFVQPKDSIDCFERTPMSNEVREKISYLNAKRWLKL